MYRGAHDVQLFKLVQFMHSVRQAVQADAPAGEKLPEAHGAQEDADEAPCTVENLPATHSVQEDAPLLIENVPGMHAKHTVEEAPPCEALPGTHGIQTPPDTPEPGVHVVHAPVLAAQVEHAEHAKQDEEPDEAV